MLTKFIAASILACASLGAHAGIIALDSSRETGNQAWTGSLGMDFDVLAPIYVTRVGAFEGREAALPQPLSGDSAGETSLDGGLNPISDFIGDFAVEVGIFDRNTESLIAGTFATITDSNSLDGRSRFVDIPDVFLGAGQYSIVARGYTSDNKNGNATFGGPAPAINDGAGVINFVGDARYMSGGFAFPTTPDSGPANRYDAGTFEFVAVPVPSSLALLGLGMLMIRRKMKS